MCRGLSWPERSLHIVEHNLRGTKLHDHVWLMVVVGIDELERHWNEIGTGVVELGAHVDLRVAGIATGKFNNFNTAMQIDGDKMTGCLAGFVSHKGVDLVRSWIAVVDVVPGGRKPIHGELAYADNEHGKQHTNAEKDQPVFLLP